MEEVRCDVPPNIGVDAQKKGPEASSLRIHISSLLRLFGGLLAFVYRGEIVQVHHKGRRHDPIDWVQVSPFPRAEINLPSQLRDSASHFDCNNSSVCSSRKRFCEWKRVTDKGCWLCAFTTIRNIVS